MNVCWNVQTLVPCWLALRFTTWKGVKKPCSYTPWISKVTLLTGTLQHVCSFTNPTNYKCKIDFLTIAKSKASQVSVSLILRSIFDDDENIFFDWRRSQSLIGYTSITLAMGTIWQLVFSRLRINVEKPSTRDHISIFLAWENNFIISMFKLRQWVLQYCIL